MTVCVGLRERNQYCTQKSRTPSTTVPDDRGTSGTKYSKSPLVVLHCSTSFGVQYCQKMLANIKTHHLSAWQFNGKRHKILPNIIMTAANVCSSCTILDAIAWRRGCSWWLWRDNGHGERTLLVSFDGQYAMGYHCLRETVAWPALQGSKWLIL